MGFGSVLSNFLAFRGIILLNLLWVVLLHFLKQGGLLLSLSYRYGFKSRFAIASVLIRNSWFAGRTLLSCHSLGPFRIATASVSNRQLEGL